jgi:hypothetical protein
MNEYKFTVWVGGVETTANYLTREQAEIIASELETNGYDDVQIEELDPSIVKLID